jgi:hypothetical protein
MGQMIVGGATRPSITPAWLLYPYAAREDCWGCGLAGDGINRPAFPPGSSAVLCVYCAELADLKIEASIR